MNNRHPFAGASRARTSESSAGIRRVDSGDLLGDTGELIITHGDSEYRLRLTRLGKLILTK